MTTNICRLAVTALFFGALILATTFAELANAEAEDSESPLRIGAYVAPLASWVVTNDNAFDDGLGATLAIGYRKGWWALEGSALIASHLKPADASEDIDVAGGSVNVLLFPFESAPNLFSLIGVGALSVDRHPEIDRGYSLTTVEAGLGYLLALGLGRYDFGVRADARYRYGGRQERVQPDPGDLEIASEFTDVLLNVGLQLPLGLAPLPAPPPPPVVVVPPADADDDGVLDDMDQCPGTPRGTQVDSVGCPLPPPPPPACTDNSDGQSISLGGCDAGETLVLRGVNFEFDKDRLTTNAKTLLNEVVSELEAHPDISVEISGHTDSKGSEAYNQNLSERRAQSVVDYLAANGIGSSRLAAVGYGEAQPVADNDTEEGRELNRRVELMIAGRDESAAPVAAPAVEETAAPATEPTEAAPEGNPPPAPTPTPTSESNELDFLLD
jgi:outer membrane protein OmpA-like peptidoglycan-associated protein